MAPLIHPETGLAITTTGQHWYGQPPLALAQLSHPGHGGGGKKKAGGAKGGEKEDHDEGGEEEDHDEGKKGGDGKKAGGEDHDEGKKGGDGGKKKAPKAAPKEQEK